MDIATKLLNIEAMMYEKYNFTAHQLIPINGHNNVNTTFFSFGYNSQRPSNDQSMTLPPDQLGQCIIDVKLVSMG